MLAVVRLVTRLGEACVAGPARLARTAVSIVALPRLGPLRYVVHVALAYLVVAVLLVYVIAPVRGIVGAWLHGDKLRYDAERWIATAIYDRTGSFAGTFDPRLDSARDVNFTDAPIELGDYTANPDHKSIPVREVPEHYWRCLLWHEDRYLGTALNPYGIDLMGVLKIPYSSIVRSIAARRPVLGVGGSTLPMQFARVIYKTPPRRDEGAFGKLRRKIGEWWMAPVIYRELTRGGDDGPLREWAANHIWLAQRTGGQPLHGVEVTSQIVFGKEARELSIAEQFILASAVNKPIILLDGDERLNAVRLDRWRYIAEVRARTCAEKLIEDARTQGEVLFELIGLAGGPPDPKVKPRLQAALDQYAPNLARRAQANPIIRANALMPAARLGLREEMKQIWGYDWRSHVRGLTATIDPADNLALGARLKGSLTAIDQRWSGRLNPGFTLDPAKATAGSGLEMPQVVVAAANLDGEIVRYFETSEMVSYFGSAGARAEASGRYDADRESRRIASTGKIIAAIGIANELRDSLDSAWHDSDAPAASLVETCARGGGAGNRRAVVAFACSLNRPVEWRLAQTGQVRVRTIIDRLGLKMPPAPVAGSETPPSTAAVRGLLAGSPQRVHQMSSIVLNALVGRGAQTVRLPSLVKSYELADAAEGRAFKRDDAGDVVPDRIIRRDAHGLIKALLQAPLCHTHAGQPVGTMKDLSAWCAARRSDIRLHFAKTGTDVNADASQTVDTWITGGLQLADGRAWSYVVMVGTGSTARPWAHNLHAAQVAAPLLEALLSDLVDRGRRAVAPAAKPRPLAPARARSAAGARQRLTAMP
jgi:penicillin-binding protein 1A